MRNNVILIAAFLSMPGCSSFDWARLAPPGIVKYEEIASKKPPNETIQLELNRNREETASSYPKIADMPINSDAEQRGALGKLNEESNSLIVSREELELQLNSDRAQANQERASREPLSTSPDIIQPSDMEE